MHRIATEGRQLWNWCIYAK